MRLVFVSVLALSLLTPALAETARGLSSAELANGLLTDGKATVVDKGIVVDDLRVSPDGRWVLFTEFGTDIKTNFVRMASSDGKNRVAVETPEGYKNSPVLHPSSRLFVSLAGNRDKLWPDGIYVKPVSGVEWTLFERGRFRDLAISDDGRFLAASTGNWTRAVVNSVVRIWPLTTVGEKAGDSYTLAPQLKGQVGKIAWGPGGQGLVFEDRIVNEDTKSQTNLYLVENASGAPAKLLRQNATRPTWRNRGPTGTLFFLETGEAGRLMAYDPTTSAETPVASFRGLTPNGLEYDRANDRLVLGVQASASAASVVAFAAPPFH